MQELKKLKADWQMAEMAFRSDPSNDNQSLLTKARTLYEAARQPAADAEPVASSTAQIGEAGQPNKSAATAPTGDASVEAEKKTVVEASDLT